MNGVPWNDPKSDLLNWIDRQVETELEHVENWAKWGNSHVCRYGQK